MTDQEKIARQDALQEIRNRIGGCFGASDGVFGSHQLDENRAKALYQMAIDNQISFQEFLEIAWGHMYKKRLTDDHIKEQLERITKKLLK
ncbi:MAG: hypothetical protein Q8K60_03400 [Parachlamydiaceae bacterium]|nr:hypothetical protein [Parachlamydiaceae bacterium]